MRKIFVYLKEKSDTIWHVEILQENGTFKDAMTNRDWQYHQVAGWIAAHTSINDEIFYGNPHNFAIEDFK